MKKKIKWKSNKKKKITIKKRKRIKWKRKEKIILQNLQKNNLLLDRKKIVRELTN